MDEMPVLLDSFQYLVLQTIFINCPVCKSGYTELLTFHPRKQLAKTKQNMQQYSNLLIKIKKLLFPSS